MIGFGLDFSLSLNFSINPRLSGKIELYFISLRKSANQRIHNDKVVITIIIIIMVNCASFFMIRSDIDNT